MAGMQIQDANAACSPHYGHDQPPSRPYRQSGRPAVVRAHSMHGFDLRFEGGILEMRTEGERTAAAGQDPGLVWLRRTIDNTALI
ncbi:hypothetical protein [Labrenzia sp. PHM005]|uniref:hypothetical protein n=1 Tax=Labrenzia sp. PHM005 TaxID=2590016 RepID=UPI00143D9012|nr:hypothetical protein [Labrenzia sp. PHM005]